MPNNTTIVWFRRDLRLHDNPAWNHALQRGGTVVPVYIHSPRDEGNWPVGAASQWWLHHTLSDLENQLSNLGLHLLCYNDDTSANTLTRLIEQTNADTVCWNRCYHPSAVQRDTLLKKGLQDRGIRVESFNGSLLLDPLKVTNKAGKPFQVFTPFWKHCKKITPAQPETESTKPLSHPLNNKPIEHLDLLPTIDWDQGFYSFWNPTRQGALQLLEQAIPKSTNYQTARDIPNHDGTSRLSPYLHFGQISPREFFYAIHSESTNQQRAEEGILRQLYWREFSAHLLYHFPHSQDLALKPEYDHFPWQFNEDYLLAWQRGRTGFPIVDAGMRQLWQTGWMHNRVRMIAGSLLVKHLLIPWQEGARWFWDTLVDADLANNTMGWQWVAGSGADASPYFRIFNPITQGKKFDPDGTYVKKWLPELTELPKEYIHSPWEASPIELAAAGIQLGEQYPEPIISHQDGRQSALNAYQQFKSSR